MEHTEWHYQEDTDIYTDHVRDVDGKLICSCSQAAKDGTTSEQHARDIVKCHNAFPAMEAALEALKIRIHFIGLPSEPEDWKKEIDLLEAALAAGGE